MRHRWEISYNGHLFADELTFDTENGAWSIVYFDKWEDAISCYNFYAQYEELEMHLTDHEYDVVLYRGEWS